MNVCRSVDEGSDAGRSSVLAEGVAALITGRVELPDNAAVALRVCGGPKRCVAALLAISGSRGSEFIAKFLMSAKERKLLQSSERV